MTRADRSFFDVARGVLAERDAGRKAGAARRAFAAWRTGRLHLDDRAPALADRPGRPDRPRLAPPRAAPKRSAGSPEGRARLLHALAHIELNAIDLAFDTAARFVADVADALDGPDGDARDFVDDWLGVGDDEARHFLLLSDRLDELGAAYGDYDAHDGLWDAAMKSKDDVLARLAAAPMVLEARGLDVAPDMAKRLRAAGDDASADILDVIYTDEIGHVGVGVRWFRRLCGAKGLRAEAAFQEIVRLHFPSGLKRPFNERARSQAGLLPDFYGPLAR